MNFIFIGDVGFDSYNNGDQLLLGGCSLNVATHFKRNAPGSLAKIISPFNNSTDANRIREHCQREGISLVPLIRNKPLPVQEIEIQEDGEKKFLNYQAKIFEEFSFSQDEIDTLRSLSGNVVSPLFTQNFQFIDKVLKAATQCSFYFDFHDAKDFDSNPDKILPYLNRCRFAQFGLSADQEELENFLCDYSRSNDVEIMITKGKDGIKRLANGHALDFFPIPEENIVDSTGAGDSFLGAYLAFQRASSLENAVEAAAAYATKTLKHLGAFSQ